MIAIKAHSLLSSFGSSAHGVGFDNPIGAGSAGAVTDYSTMLIVAGALLSMSAIVWLWRIYRPGNQPPRIFDLNSAPSGIAPKKNKDARWGTFQLDLNVLDSFAGGIAVVDRDGRLTYANGACARMYGYPSAESLLGCRWRSLYTSREMVRLESEHLPKFYESGAWRGEAEGRRRDGHTFHQHVSLIRLTDEGFVCLLQDMTELRELQTVSTRREDAYRRMFETLRDVYYEVDISGTILEISESVSRISGYAREDLLGRSLYDLYANSEDRNRVLEGLQKENHVDDFEIRLRDADGRVHPCSVTATLVLEEEGVPPRIVGVLRNISDRKQAEMALRSSEERFRVAFQTSPDAVNINVLEGGEYVDINEGFTQLTGYTREDVIGLTSAEIDIWADLADRQRLVELLKRDGSVNNLEAKFRMKDGRIRVGLMSARVIVLTGQPCILSITRDIQDWKQAEERVRESEARFKELAELLPQVVFEVNAEGLITYMNRFGVELSGYEEADMNRGLFVYDLLSGEDLERVWDQRRGKMRLSGFNGLEFVFRRKNGDPVQACGYANIVTRGDEAVGLRGIVIDLTEQVRLRSLAARAQRLETAGIVAGQVAHDFNNLLAPLMAYPELMREELPPDHSAQVHIDAMEQAASQIAEINQQLLTLGRRGHYNTQPLNLNSLVSQVIDGMAPLPESLEVVLHLRDDLLKAEVGASQITRVLSNLILNARDAMDDSGTLKVTTDNVYLDRMCIRTEEVPQGEYVCVTVADEGCGIPTDLLPQIFDPFFTTKQAECKRGSGLGLSVVHSIMQDHHGYVDVHTALEQGTTFYLYFPICRTDTGQDETVDAGHIPRGGGEHILIVDDDMVQREVTEALLTRLGYTVTRAGSGEEALEILQDIPFDLILLDMIMPGGIDGTETLRRARETHPDLRALIVSGFSETDRVSEALALGAGEFVRKPLQLHSLARAVQAELNRRRTDSSVLG